jgi:hypothetical protein
MIPENSKLLSNKEIVSDATVPRKQSGQLSSGFFGSFNTNQGVKPPQQSKRQTWRKTQD